MTATSEILGGAPPAYWVSGANYTQGQVKRSGVDHQLYTRIVTGAGTTDPSIDATNWRPEGMRAIKSIQRGVITFTGTATAATATITSVDTAKTELRFLGTSPSSDSSTLNEGMAVVSLTNSTTVTATRRFGGNSNNPIVSWELTEYY